MGIKTTIQSEPINPLFSWTANWTNTFDHRKEDMVVMVNNATFFTVTIYGIKRNGFKDITSKITTAIRATLLAMNINPEMIDEYLRLAGEIEFTTNHDRKMTAQVNRRGLEAAFVVGNAVIDSEWTMKFENTLGYVVSDRPVNYSTNQDDCFFPYEKMIEMLSELTEKPPYRYRVFELKCTLDLEIYKAERRFIVAADIEFSKLHKILQNIFSWKNYHLYDFAVFDGKSREPVARLVPNEEDLEYDDSTALIVGHKLSEFLPQNKFIIYTYDMGDNWEHKIELVREIAEHNEPSPYLLEAVGQAPPEDVGGVGGFIDFREIFLDPNHPEHIEMKEWAGYWSPELSEWERRPGKIRY
jgi:hypothetical protein